MVKVEIEMPLVHHSSHALVEHSVVVATAVLHYRLMNYFDTDR